MVFDVLTSAPFLRGLVIALLGVGFWVGGMVVANYLWNRWRDD